MKVAAALFALLLVWAGVVGDAQASSVTVGTYNGTPNCFPFSCFAAFSGNEFQEVYASSAFTAPITIDAVSFFEAGPGGLDSATYSVSFYTTTQPVDGLSTLGADNLGTLLSNFGAYSLSGAAPSVLTLNGNAFTYNPSSGNLLMVVTVTGFTQPSGNYAYFQSDSTGSVLSRYFSYEDSPIGATDAFGLVTEFSTAVPEPSTWAMAMLGFLGLGLAAHRSRTRAFRAA